MKEKRTPAASAGATPAGSGSMTRPRQSFHIELSAHTAYPHGLRVQVAAAITAAGSARQYERTPKRWPMLRQNLAEVATRLEAADATVARGPVR